MRSLFSRIIPTFVAVPLCLAWLAVPAAAKTPRVYQIAENWADNGQGQCVEQGSCNGSATECEVPYELCQRPPRWSIVAEGLVLQRTNTRSQLLFTNPQTPTVGLLDARNMDFALAFGPKLDVIRHNECGWDLEVVYFWLDGFTAESSVPGVSRLVTDVHSTGFYVTNGEARYTSALYNGELNLRRQWTEWLTFLAGFRMGQLNEHYLGTGTDLTTLQPDWLAVSASNHFYGFQLGADMEVFNRGGPLKINALCKAGVFGNAAKQGYVRAQWGYDTESLGASRNQGAFLGEAGVVATYALTKRLAFRASAEAMWLTGMALAPEQIDGVNLRTGIDEINTSGAVFYYGSGMGLEYRF